MRPLGDSDTASGRASYHASAAAAVLGLFADPADEQLVQQGVGLTSVYAMCSYSTRFIDVFRWS